MNVRDATAEDVPAISAIHAEMGMDYRMPDLESPLFVVRKVTTDDSGAVVGACFLRISAETYLWLSPALDARGKMDAMSRMQPEVIRDAWLKGIDEIEARVPETIQRRFHKRLKQLGWTPNRPDWHPWSIPTCATP